MSKPITILVADDHAMMRGMLRDRLSAESDMRVVACVSNADEAVEQADTHQPDVGLLDIDMPGISSFEAARSIAISSSNTRIIFLSAFFHDRYIEQALEVKAWGYITKNESEHVVINAVRDVVSGLAYYSPEIQSRIVIDSGGTGAGSRLLHESRSRAGTLTGRELEVVRYLAEGLSKKEIAHRMHLSMHTVNRHSTNIMTKLRIHDRVELARFAIREGIAEA